MFNKIASLNNLKNAGLNVHNFEVPEDFSQLWFLIKRFKQCTIRYDHNEITESLPFEVVHENEWEDFNKLFERISLLWYDSLRNNFKLIVADGLKYDPIQEYNMTVKFQKNGDFIFEASELKIPQRHMYRHPLLSCSGNIASTIHEWEIHNNRYGLDKTIIKRDLERLYVYNIFDKWLELTKYPEPVGIYKKDIVFWQVL